MKIPFAGKVCPYCQRDKSSDQREYVLTIILGVPLACGGGYVFGFWGFVGGVIAAVVMSAMIVKKNSSPPQVQMVSDHAEKLIDVDDHLDHAAGGDTRTCELRAADSSRCLKSRR